MKVWRTWMSKCINRMWPIKLALVNHIWISRVDFRTGRGTGMHLVHLSVLIWLWRWVELAWNSHLPPPAMRPSYILASLSFTFISTRRTVTHDPQSTIKIQSNNGCQQQSTVPCPKIDTHKKWHLTMMLQSFKGKTTESVPSGPPRSLRW